MWRGLAVTNDLGCKGVAEQLESVNTKLLLAGRMSRLALDYHQRHVRYWLCEFSTELPERCHAGNWHNCPSVTSKRPNRTRWDHVEMWRHSCNALSKISPLRYVSFRVSSDGVYL